MPYVTKPGLAFRATAAFALLNAPLVGTVAFVYFITNGADDFWIKTFLAIAVIVAEFAITISTIAPPLYDWIKGQEYVEDKKS
jgi:hypothetical protein